jgi:hypothetical protein
MELKRKAEETPRRARAAEAVHLEECRQRARANYYETVIFSCRVGKGERFARAVPTRRIGPREHAAARHSRSRLCPRYGDWLWRRLPERRTGQVDE